MIHCETRSQVISALYLFPVNTITVAVLGFHRRERAPMGECQKLRKSKCYTGTAIFTARKRSLRRLCFYTCLSVHRGGRWYPSMPCRSPGGISQHALQVSRSTLKGELEGSGWGGVSRPTPGGGGLQAHTQGGSPGPYLGGGGISQHALRQTPSATATAAGGMHPTGMHSCFVYFYGDGGNYM